MLLAIPTYILIAVAIAVLLGVLGVLVVSYTNYRRTKSNTNKPLMQQVADDEKAQQKLAKKIQ